MGELLEATNFGRNQSNIAIIQQSMHERNPISQTYKESTTPLELQRTGQTVSLQIGTSHPAVPHWHETPYELFCNIDSKNCLVARFGSDIVVHVKENAPHTHRVIFIINTALCSNIGI